jgi:prevent-host-death family protein
MKTVSSTEAKAQLDALLAEVERTGSPVTITSRGRPVAVLSALRPRPRSFGQLPNMVIGADFDEPLPARNWLRGREPPVADTPAGDEPTPLVVHKDPSGYPHAAVVRDIARWQPRRRD